MDGKRQFSLAYLMAIVFWIAAALAMIRFLLPLVMPAALIGYFPSIGPESLAPFSLVLIPLVIIVSSMAAGAGIGRLSRAPKGGAVIGAAIGTVIAAPLFVLLLVCVGLENGWPF